MSALLRASSSRSIARRYLPLRQLRPRTYATELPRPPPPQEKPEVETFSDTSRPQPYYAKHPPTRELPPIKKTWPVIVGAIFGGLAGWVAFMAYVTNQEKISSSVVRQIMRAVREDPVVQEVLGSAIRPQPEWWLNGDPLIRGKISQLQGNVDVSFRIRGSKDSGTLYFTSIRKEKGLPFTILRFKVIGDEGTVILIDAKPI
ncbi:putative cytochrome oxidase complex assembly protein 1 [Lyophyllum shimeji]|uniref:Cytochrome oxidase complex assembly protein 1 n=1 Tax=Lyophyllum shimeji TaxID=47721 RepID=A0A9P3PHN0_LYOSH|nr:putative cytochrome oxidase complex assembly protein 1 [Lyophyllum shimeji]